MATLQNQVVNISQPTDGVGLPVTREPQLLGSGRKENKMNKILLLSDNPMLIDDTPKVRQLLKTWKNDVLVAPDFQYRWQVTIFNENHLKVTLDSDKCFIECTKDTSDTGRLLFQLLSRLDTNVEYWKNDELGRIVKEHGEQWNGQFIEVAAVCHW